MRHGLPFLIAAVVAALAASGAFAPRNALFRGPGGFGAHAVGVPGVR
jgi:hypothetical protein